MYQLNWIEWNWFKWIFSIVEFWLQTSSQSRISTIIFSGSSVGLWWSAFSSLAMAPAEIALDSFLSIFGVGLGTNFGSFVDKANDKRRFILRFFIKVDVLRGFVFNFLRPLFVFFFAVWSCSPFRIFIIWHPFCNSFVTTRALQLYRNELRQRQ